MEFFQKRFEQVKATWGQMSGSGRLALVLAGLLLIAVLVILSHSAGTESMTPLPTRFAAGEVNQASGLLNVRGIRNEIRGDQIYVVGDASAALQVLAGSEALPENGIDFKALLKESNPWSTEAEQQRRWNLALKTELEKLLRAMPGVRAASVNINTGNPNTLSRSPEGASASVTVSTSATQPLRKSTAIAMADMVAGAVAGLARENVSVIDATNGTSFSLKSDDGTGEYIPLIAQYESYFDGRVRSHFSYIPKLKVTVHVVPNLDRKSSREHSVDPSKAVGVPTNERNESSSGGSASGAVGVTPNVGDRAAAPVSAASDTLSEESVGTPIDWSRIDSVVEHMSGDVKEMTVSVNVPYSYFTQIERLRMGEGDAAAKIDDAKLQSTITTELAKITEQVKTIVNAKTDSDVRVNWYYDLASAETTASMEMEASGPGVWTMTRQYGPSVGLGVLAMLALLMVYSVVRKVQPIAPPPEAASHEAVGDAGLTLDSILEGVELEADAIRASKMQEQISSMIKEDPESVAGLVKRWIAQEQ